jgi:hypothetical protein
MSAATKDRIRSRYCLSCAEWHAEGHCQTVRDVRVPPAPEYVVQADRFPTRAPEGPFRLGGRRHR